MATALEQYRQKATALSRVREHRQTVRRVVDAGEMAVGAVAAGALDAKMPPIVGAPPSLLVGVALVAAGVGMEQRDAVALGLGMLIPHAYQVGAGLAA